MNDTAPFTDLILAILAVNGWTLEKTGALLNGLQSHGLTTPSVIVGRDYGQNATALENAGYRRGDYMVSLLTDRIIAAAKTWSEHNLEPALSAAEIQRDAKAIAALIEPIHGVGKTVISNYLLLRGFN